MGLPTGSVVLHADIDAFFAQVYLCYVATAGFLHTCAHLFSCRLRQTEILT